MAHGAPAGTMAGTVGPNCRVSMAIWGILTQVFEESALSVTCDELTIVLWGALPKRSAVVVWTPSALGGVAGHQHFFCSTQ